MGQVGLQRIVSKIIAGIVGAVGIVAALATPNYDSASSGIGYATSSSLLGSYSDQSTYAPWVGTRGIAQGPQAPCVFIDATGATRMAFAAWYGAVGYANGGGRSLWVGNLASPLSGQPTLS